MAKKLKKIRNVDELCVASIRATCIDMINKSKSGHPGACLGIAPIIYELYKDFVVANPFQPNWINRDRVVLSAGHASALLYTILHLCSYDISIDDLQEFRQFGSKTPGHPEVNVTPGVDAGSGPLGQGIAQAVGMAMAETMLSAQYGSKLYNHYTYCICGDGCLEEGISQEAISFAGLQRLNKLILIYDSNDVTLDGALKNSSDDDVITRFLSAHWNVIYVKDGNNLKKIKRAISNAQLSIDKPTLVMVKTIIGYGSKNQGTNKVHGSPLGEEDGLNAKLSYGYTYPPFEIPQEVYDHLKDTFLKRGELAYQKYQNVISKLQENDPYLYTKIMELSTNNVRDYLNEKHLAMDELDSESTRNTSLRVLNYYHELLSNFVGGSADVASSVMTKLANGTTYSYKNRKGTNINWGIREFFMCSAANGILLHGGLRTYVGSFLVFSDYSKAAIRMAALQQLPSIYLFSHDSLAVGEDGPTHQPVEQLAALRAIPNLNVFRPCDAKETYASYRLALESNKTPSAIILTRQNLPLLKNSSNYDLVKKGGYIISKERGNYPEFTIIASGSEVSLALDVKKYLYSLGLDIRVVSMPCVELFEAQDNAYQTSVLGKDYAHRISIEMGSTLGWHKFAKFSIGVDKFGASGKANDVIKNFGFTKETIAKIILDHIR
ncbi:MAG: transketolase [Candidatus Onthovivens sp.]|nr:transketolase [Mollicutes bacterium]MDY4857481.1 transketolase [Candidatus Onthovivens sp.]MDY4937013.1 transketolase [Candidatus Onthovivens sp.]